MGDSTGQRIFLSYRRTDSQSQANALYEGLRHRMRDASIFMDLDSLAPGVDFEAHIRNEIENCQVVLVMIGDNWLDARPGSDVRRIDEPADFVRLEVENALQSDDVRVIPVLVEGAPMPGPKDLPESIARLARLNAIELSDKKWTSDVDLLVRALERPLNAPPPEAPPSMTLAEVNGTAVSNAVSVMPPVFRTKDLSEHFLITQAHPRQRDLPIFHAMIGKYLTQHREVLRLAPPQPAVNDRGAVWTREPTRPLPTAPQFGQPRAQPPQQPYQQPQFAQPQFAPPRPRRGGAARWVLTVLPLVTCGLTSFVPPLWLASQRREDTKFRNLMLVCAVILAITSIAGFALVGSGPQDAAGTPTGPQSSIGVVLVLFSMVCGATLPAILGGPPANRTEQPQA